MSRLFFCSSRIRHTSCALVTEVQTCALPIWAAVRCRVVIPKSPFYEPSSSRHRRTAARILPGAVPPKLVRLATELSTPSTEYTRSAERRVGKECGSTHRSQWSSSHYRNKQNHSRTRSYTIYSLKQHSY